MEPRLLSEGLNVYLPPTFMDGVSACLLGALEYVASILTQYVPIAVENGYTQGSSPITLHGIAYMSCLK